MATEVYMYQVFNSSNEMIGECTPGGPGSNFIGGVAVDKNNAPEIIMRDNYEYRLNPAWKLAWVKLNRKSA